MNRIFISRLLSIFGVVVILFGALGISHLREARDVRWAGSVVGEEAISLALKSVIPERLTLSDELEFHRARLVQDPKNTVSLGRIIQASQLRFQAYGRTEDLKRSEEALLLLQQQTGTPMGAIQASMELTRHRFSAASETLEKEPNVLREDDVLLWRRFDVALARGEYDRAAGLLSASGRTESFGWHTRKARVEDRIGNLNGAVRHMRRAATLAVIYAQSAAVQGWTKIELAHFEHHSGDPQSAAVLYLEALQVLPGSPAALEGLAWIAYAVDRDLDVAKQLFERALENGAHNDLYLPLMEIAALQENREEQATQRTVFLQRATADPASEHLHLRPLALTLAEEEATVDQAEIYALKDLAQRKDAGSWAVSAWVDHRLGRSDEAWEKMVHALAWGEPDPWIYALAGQVALGSGRESEGIRLLLHALKAEEEIGPHLTQEIQLALAEASDVLEAPR